MGVGDSMSEEKVPAEGVPDCYTEKDSKQGEENCENPLPGGSQDEDGDQDDEDWSGEETG